MALRLQWMMILVLVVVLSGCRQQEDFFNSRNLDIRLSVDELVVGETMLVVTILDANGQPVEGATVDVRGDMSHAGMVPVERQVENGINGEYEVPFNWTMGGDWVVDVTVSLDGETVARQRFDFAIESGGEMDMEMEDGQSSGGDNALGEE